MPTAPWRVQDLVNNLLGAGFCLEGMEEFHARREDLPGYSWWYKTATEAESDRYQKLDIGRNPWAALPQWIALYGRKSERDK